MTPESHRFQVATWLPGNDNPKSILQKGHWSEAARCPSSYTANEVAFCLSLRHPDGVRLAELKDGRFVGYKFIPESACELEKEG